MTDTTKEADLRQPAPRNGWMISALGVVQICAFGSLFYSFPLIAEAMRIDLGWSKPEIYGAATLGLALAGFASYPVGAAIDRGLGRYVMSLASVAAGLLLIAWSQLDDIVLFYVVFAAIGCLQAATLYEAAFAVVARRVGAGNARDAITMLTLWGGFASTVFIPLIQLLIEWYGWRGALVWLGLVNIVICAGLNYLFIDPKRDHPEPVREAHEDRPLAGRRAVSWAFRQPVFWALMITMLAYAAAFSALIFHLYPLLLERGLSAAGVVAVLAVIGPSQVAGRVLIWVIAKRASVRSVGSVIVAVFPLAVVGFALAPPDVLVMGGIAALYGAANGVMTIVRGLAVPEMLSREAYGAINGALLAPSHMVQAAAPLVAAWLWAASGSYDVVLIVILAGAMVMAAAFWMAAMLSRRAA